MSVTAAILGAGALGAAGSYFASSKAADAGEAAADKSAAVQRELYYQTRSDTEPYRALGLGAAGKLARLAGLGSPDQSAAEVGQFYASPGYQFRLGEGQKALERSAAARGMLNSGATLKGITRYGQDYASNEFGNYVNTLGGLAGYGPVATNQQVAANNSLGQGLSNSAIAGGQARVSGYTNMGNTIGSLANTGLWAYLYGGR